MAKKRKVVKRMKPKQFNIPLENGVEFANRVKQAAKGRPIVMVVMGG